MCRKFTGQVTFPAHIREMEMYRKFANFLYISYYMIGHNFLQISCTGHMKFPTDFFYKVFMKFPIHFLYTISVEFPTDFPYTISMKFPVDFLYTISMKFPIDFLYTISMKFPIDFLYTISMKFPIDQWRSQTFHHAWAMGGQAISHATHVHMPIFIWTSI